MVSRVGCIFLIISAYFALFLLSQNLKVAIYKGYIVSGRSKKAKKNVVIAVFLKIEARLKALSMRF